MPRSITCEAEGVLRSVPEMIKCQHCGTFVPAEKAFCPNCSEPMEVEDRPDRAHSFSADMMLTIRDDPKKYKELFLKPPAKKQPAPPQPTPPTNVQPPAPVTDTGYAPTPSAGYNNWPNAPMPVAQSRSKRNLVLGIGAVLIAAVVILLLFVFKVI